MASRINSSLTLKRFMLRSEVLKLYRDFLRTIRQVSDTHHRRELAQWVRHDFKQNKYHKEEEAIKMLITKGKMSLRELQTTVQMAS